MFLIDLWKGGSGWGSGTIVRRGKHFTFRQMANEELNHPRSLTLDLVAQEPLIAVSTYTVDELPIGDPPNLFFLECSRPILFVRDEIPKCEGDLTVRVLASLFHYGTWVRDEHPHGVWLRTPRRTTPCFCTWR